MTSNRRRLSHLEQMAALNFTCFVRVDSTFSLIQLRSALAGVQRKHPALRALIREEGGALYYDADTASEIPVRVVKRLTDQDYRRECRLELMRDFASEEPLLRVVWLESEQEAGLIFTTSHRICDGMSVFTIVKDVLRAIHAPSELNSYPPITTGDLIANAVGPLSWARKMQAGLLNAVLMMVPCSRPAPANTEHDLEWGMTEAASSELRARCKAEGVSVHAAFVTALDAALSAVLAHRTPKYITCPIDMRRGRFPALADDMLFYGGGNFKVQTGEFASLDFWTAVRSVNEQMRKQIEQEVKSVPSRLQFFELLRPLRNGQVHWIVRIGDLLRSKRTRLSALGLSNLGNVAVNEEGSPRVKDLRFYAHSLNFRVSGLFPYTVNREMRFSCMTSDRCISRAEMEAVGNAFIATLTNQLDARPTPCAEIDRIIAAAAH